MKTLWKSLALAYLAMAMAAGSAAQNVPEPSAVSAVAPFTQQLAGTLFFNQQQRDRMDRARKSGAIAIAAEVGSDDPAPSALNGFVKRSDGQSAIWVDGQPRYNVQSEGVRRLQPSDVGGSADTVKVLSSAPTLAVVNNKLPARKAPARKASRKRPAGTR